MSKHDVDKIDKLLVENDAGCAELYFLLKNWIREEMSIADILLELTELQKGIELTKKYFKEELKKEKENV